jgi:6,7-dimethyl-8-ribityllumazine synthase
MTARNPHILIVDARFYDDIADELIKGAVGALEAAGASWSHVSVPGVLEIPAALAFAAKGDWADFDGYVLLGCVIRGETSHYDIVANESARAVMDFTMREQLALGNGILTVENRDQAWARASTEGKNKGADAANAALHMVRLKNELGAS